MLLLRCNNLVERLKRFEKEIFEKWAEKVPNQIETVRVLSENFQMFSIEHAY